MVGRTCKILFRLADLHKVWTYGCKLMKHIKIDAALKLFPEKVRPYITIVGELLVLAFAAYIVVDRCRTYI